MTSSHALIRPRCWATWAVLAILVVFSSGCGGSDPTAAAAAAQASASAAQGDGVHQYRAVCTEKEMHGGNNYVLSTWLDSRDKVQALGDYHGSFKEKGHQIRIEERVKPTKTTP